MILSVVLLVENQISHFIIISTNVLFARISWEKWLLVFGRLIYFLKFLNIITLSLFYMEWFFYFFIFCLSKLKFKIHIWRMKFIEYCGVFLFFQWNLYRFHLDHIIVALTLLQYVKNAFFARNMECRMLHWILKAW